eukprot:GHVU01111539.1.p1 GENE.GHVU01111539.1~~GHVU01111539.1.p1  ORF type:complete len:119 (+),score=12.97 GHVU01111539.1:149-505(+)
MIDTSIVKRANWDSLDEVTFTKALMYKLTLAQGFPNKEEIKSIGKSVRDGTSSIFIKVDTDDGPMWRQLSLEGDMDLTKVKILGQSVQIVIAKNEGVWAARRGGRRVDASAVILSCFE